MRTTRGTFDEFARIKTSEPSADAEKLERIAKYEEELNLVDGGIDDMNQKFCTISKSEDGKIVTINDGRTGLELEFTIDKKTGLWAEKISKWGRRRSYNGLIPSAEFDELWEPPEYILDGVIQDHCVYTVTGFTGHGKTSVMLKLAMDVAHGHFFGERETVKGAVVILVGENPSNVVGQWRALCLANNVDPADVDVYFHSGRFSLSQNLNALISDLKKIPNLKLVIIDTMQAFFEGDNDNDNIQMLQQAENFRPIAEIGPTVLIPAHPSGKTATKANLVPRGGTALLNEVDGNFTVWAEKDGTVYFHTQGKHRGVFFDPIPMKLEEMAFPEMVDREGRAMKMSVCRPLMITESMALQTMSVRHDLQIVALIIDDGLRTIRGLADALGVSKSVVGRNVEKLTADKVIRKRARIYELMPKAQNWFDRETELQAENHGGLAQP